MDAFVAQFWHFLRICKVHSMVCHSVHVLLKYVSFQMLHYRKSGKICQSMRLV